MISKALYQEQFPRNTIEDAIAALKNFVELLKQIIQQNNLQDETLANAAGKLETKIQKIEDEHKQQQQQK